MATATEKGVVLDNVYFRWTDTATRQRCAVLLFDRATPIRGRRRRDAVELRADDDESLDMKVDQWAQENAINYDILTEGDSPHGG